MIWYDMTWYDMIWYDMIWYDRRKFRSQISDNMDRWKSRGGKSQRREEKKNEDQRKRKRQKKEDAGARKGSKVANHCVFPMICGSGGLKSRLAKAAGCGATWPDARGKIARHCGAKHRLCLVDPQWHQDPAFATFLRPEFYGKPIILETETGPRGFGLSKKCTPLWREAHFEVKQVKSDGFGALLDVQMLFCVAGARDDALCQKWAKGEGL